MATLELYEPRSGKSLGASVTLINKGLDFGGDSQDLIQGIMERTLRTASPADTFKQFTGWSNSQGTAGLRLKEE